MAAMTSVVEEINDTGLLLLVAEVILSIGKAVKEAAIIGLDSKLGFILVIPGC